MFRILITVSACFFTAGYNHITESMHTLNDMNHEDMALAQHYDDAHDYLDAPTGHPGYLDASEFYPSQAGLPMPETKYQPQYAPNKPFLSRGLRLLGNL